MPGRAGGGIAAGGGAQPGARNAGRPLGLAPLLLAAAALLIAGCGSGGVARSSGPAARDAGYSFDARLSLTGGCGVSAADRVADPGCPYRAGRRPRPFAEPCGVASDRLGYIYVSSSGRSGAHEGRVDVFDPRGRFLTEVELPAKISERPCRIDVDSRGRIYIAARPLAVNSTPANLDIHARPIPTAFRYAILRYAPRSYPPRPGISYGQPIIFALTGESYGVAVDPSDDYVYVASVPVFEFTPGGRPVKAGGARGGFGSGARDVDVWGRNHDVYVSTEVPEGRSWQVRVYAGRGRHRLLETVPRAPSDVAPYHSIAVDQTSGGFLIEDFSKHRIGVFMRSRETGKLEPAGEITHGRYLEAIFEGTSDLAVDDSPRSPNRGYVFATSGPGPGHLYAFAPLRPRTQATGPRARLPK
jgi:hypothetical protein